MACFILEIWLRSARSSFSPSVCVSVHLLSTESFSMLFCGRFGEKLDENTIKLKCVGCHTLQIYYHCVFVNEFSLSHSLESCNWITDFNVATTARISSSETMTHTYKQKQTFTCTLLQRRSKWMCLSCIFYGVYTLFTTQLNKRIRFIYSITVIKLYHLSMISNTYCDNCYYIVSHWKWWTN